MRRVRAGGGSNHRFGLDDAVLVKDNHLAFAGGIEPALRGIRERVGHLVKVEVEVDTLDHDTRRVVLTDGRAGLCCTYYLLNVGQIECAVEQHRLATGESISADALIEALPWE